jgi:alkyl hydroperoxide reductase subunit AhpC
VSAPTHEMTALCIGDTAPDFEAESTEGTIRFHEWVGDSWAVLFSHPKDFTPVCTTELGYMARIRPEFDRRGVKAAHPMTTGRNFDEVLRVIDSLQLTANHKVATPVNWRQGQDVIIAGSVTNEAAAELYPEGWESPKPYIRFVPQPRS